MQPYIINNLLDELGLGFVYPLEHINNPSSDKHSPVIPRYGLLPKQNPNQDCIFEESRGWHNTKWIMLSSSFFSIPAFRAFSMISRLSKPIDTYANYMAILLILSSLVSMNYWRDAKRGWRRNMDMILAKITFLTGVYYGIIYVPGVSNPYLFVVGKKSYAPSSLRTSMILSIPKGDEGVSTENIPYPILFYSSIALSLYTYSQSTKYALKNDDTWVKYHFAFHVFVTIGAFSIMEPLYFDKTRG